MLELGVDELTIVLQLNPTIKNRYVDTKDFEWRNFAEKIIDRFVEKAAFKKIFGSCIIESRVPKGYTIAYTYGEHNCYLALGYNDSQMQLGVIVKLSAQALDYYCEKSNLKVYEFLQNIQDSFYVARLSRIDFMADYIDEEINVTKIYQGMIDNSICTCIKYITKSGEISYKRNMMQFHGYLIGSEVPTIYIGSVQSNSQLRIYNKKREQIEKNGSKLEKAIKSLNWVRFEAVFKKEYAHQLSEAILSIQDDVEFSNLIASTMLQRYCFMYFNNGEIIYETEYSKMLRECINTKVFVLRAPSSRSFELVKSINYIFNGSGILSLLYKILEIWGEDGVSTFVELIKEYLKEFKPNDDCRYWLRKNKNDYQSNFLDFYTFIEASLFRKIEMEE